MPRCEAAGKVQDGPEPDREIGQGKDRTDEREQTFIGSTETVGRQTLVDTAIHEPEASRNLFACEVGVLEVSQREHQRLRCREGIHPGRISLMRNVETPNLGSSNGKPTARKAQFPSGNRMDQEANAASRKARGNHNPADRAHAQPERVLT